MFKKSSIFKVHCKSFAIAQSIAKNTSNVSSLYDSCKPPFCLRIVKEYRNEPSLLHLGIA